LGKSCGKPAADYFCKKKNYRNAVQFQQDANIGNTKLLKTGQVCNKPHCDGFAFIICEKETSQPIGKVQEQKPRPNAKVYTGTEVTLVYYRAPAPKIKAYPGVLTPSLVRELQAKKLILREVEGEVRSVAPEPE
jgi:hypothetical protein